MYFYILENPKQKDKNGKKESVIEEIQRKTEENNEKRIIKSNLIIHIKYNTLFL